MLEHPFDSLIYDFWDVKAIRDSFNFTSRNNGFAENENLLVSPFGIEKFYTEYSDGFYIEWEDGERQEYIKILDSTTVLESVRAYQSGEVNDDFGPEDYVQFAHVSPEISCGVMVTPEFVGTTVYSHLAGEPDFYSLDIDFEGFTVMAREAKIFTLWTEVLKELQSGVAGFATENMRENCGKIFPDFEWDKFVEVYAKVRLSK